MLHVLITVDYLNNSSDEIMVTLVNSQTVIQSNESGLQTLDPNGIKNCKKVAQNSQTAAFCTKISKNFLEDSDLLADCQRFVA